MLILKNIDKKQKSFMYQNLQRSKCFNVNFSRGNFNYASFRGAHMKACNFSECTFVETEFVGSNLKESQFRNAHFENTLFEGSKLELVDFKGATFKNVIFVDTDLKKVLNLNVSNPEIKVYEHMPELALNEELIEALTVLMQNEHVQRARVLDTKDKQISPISVQRLHMHFEESDLIERLNLVGSQIDRDFYTLSYLIKLLAKVK